MDNPIYKFWKFQILDSILNYIAQTIGNGNNIGFLFPEYVLHSNILILESMGLDHHFCVRLYYTFYMHDYVPLDMNIYF